MRRKCFAVYVTYSVEASLSANYLCMVPIMAEKLFASIALDPPEREAEEDVKVQI